MSGAAMADTALAEDVTARMNEIGRNARRASRALALASADRKKAALLAMAAALRAASGEILAENARDVAQAQASGQPASFIDRLLLDEARLEDIAQAVEAIAALPDPVGRVLATFERPNGLVIERVATPLGVIGVIFESRPNVTADAGALCVMAGNAAILRAGSDSFCTSSAIARAMASGLREAGLPEHAIQLVPTRDRAAVGAMLTGLGGCIDVIVPRGGKSLVARVQEEARVPVFAHLEGLCHVFVHEQADLDMALAIVRNAKLRRTGVCGSAETLLVDRACARPISPPSSSMLIDAGCEVRGDDAACAADSRACPGERGGLAHGISRRHHRRAGRGRARRGDGAYRGYSSAHTDAIITADQAAAERFLAEVDSAIVVHNASTQFADGGEFGFGAEIGIATGRMHARGPVGVEQLTSFKYRVRGSGQTRP